MSKNKKRNINTIIESIQKILLYILLIILPIVILPFPWDFMEKGVSIAILSFTTGIVTLEVVKIIWSEKFLFLKRSSDTILFSLFVSLVLTTVFAYDTNLSLFGFNYRFSAGLIGIGSILVLTFLSRSFLSKKKDIMNVINAFLLGSILTSFFSLISLFGGNILNAIPKLSSLSEVGFPIIGAPVVLVIYNCVAILFSKISLEFCKEKEIGDTGWFSIIAIIVNTVSLLCFAVDPIALITSISFLVIWVAVSIVILDKESSSSKKSQISSMILPIIIIVLALLMQIDEISNIFLKDIEVLSPLILSIDFSWQVVSQSLMSSLKNGIFGVGLDTFGTVFTALKPISLTGIDLVNGFNEILTSLSNMGFLWLVIWLILGWYIGKDLVNDLKNYNKEKKILVLFDTILLFIFLTSFLTTYTATLRFVFFLTISLNVVLRSLIDSEDVDSLLLKMWTMGTGGKGKKGALTIPIFLTGITVLISLLLLFKLGSITISSLYLLRAENYIIEENEKYIEIAPTSAQQSEFVDNIYSWYKQALRYDKRNPLVNRKFSLIAIDKMGVVFSEYEVEEDETLLNDIVLLRNEAFEYSKTAINLSPSLYSGYNNRALIYMGLVNLGYTDYIRDAISAIDEAIVFKPWDYQNYYHKAQLYYLLQDYGAALDASTQTLTINGSYIPALVISANINGIQGKTEIQLSYFEAVKTILEANDQQDTQLYIDITEQISNIEVIPEDTGSEVSHEIE
ncbi:TPA: hypothetical protein DEP90_02735 [Patescibacteria group bacterium]|nr:hypothetical protein [Patescibacteria group bacterium]